MRKGKYKISYIRKPFAKRSIISALAALAALALALVSLFLSVRSGGNGGLEIASWAVSSMLFSAVSIFYGGLSFIEKERNYILSKIGLAISAGLLVFWICVVAAGVLGSSSGLE